MASSFEQFIIEYSNKDELNSDNVGGHIHKQIVMVNDDSYFYRKECASAESRHELPRPKTLDDCMMFDHLYKELQCGAHYSTYLNGLVNPQDGSEPYYPHKVSCVLKRFASEKEVKFRSERLYVDYNLSTLYNEVVGSRLINAMGVDTVYNMPISSYPQYMLYEEYPRFDTVLSVDFMQGGYSYEDLRCLGLICFPNVFNDQGMQELEDALYKFGREHNIPNLDEQVKNVTKTLVEQILVKMLVCADTDMHQRNFMIKWRDGVDLGIAPCYDMELIFNNGEDSWLDFWLGVFRKQVKEEIFPYLSKKMPELLDDFIARVKNLVRSGTLDKVMTESLPVPSEVYSKKLKYLHKQCDILEEEWIKTIIGAMQPDR